MTAPVILIIDDHALFRSGIAAMLSTALDTAVIWQSETLEEALADETGFPRIVLLDIQLHGLNGLEGVDLLKRKWPGAQIVMVSAFDQSDVIAEALHRGATAFLSKTERPERMISVLRDLLESENSKGEPHRCQPVRPLLTPRQREVLDLMNQGLSNKVIGRRLGVSEHTIRGHVQATLLALGASSRSEAAFAARRLGLLH